MSIESVTFGTDTQRHTIPARTVHVAELPPLAPETSPATKVMRRRQLAAQVRVPADDDFPEDDPFLNARPVEALARQLIEDWPELRHIRETTVAYLWKRKGGKSKGALVFGKCSPLSGVAKHGMETDFAIWLAADHCRDAAFGAEQFEALVYHELKHIGYVVDEDESSDTYGEMTIKAVGHDVEGFFDEIRRYGAWTQPLRNTEHEFTQLALSSDGEGR